MNLGLRETETTVEITPSCLAWVNIPKHRRDKVTFGRCYKTGEGCWQVSWYVCHRLVVNPLVLLCF